MEAVLIRSMAGAVARGVGGNVLFLNSASVRVGDCDTFVVRGLRVGRSGDLAGGFDERFCVWICGTGDAARCVDGAVYIVDGSGGTSTSSCESDRNGACDNLSPI